MDLPPQSAPSSSPSAPVAGRAGGARSSRARAAMAATLKGLPSTICDARALSTLELLSNPVQSIPDCLCDSNIVRTMSLTAELLRNQPDCLARTITTLSAQRGNLREVPARVGELVELIVSPACTRCPHVWELLMM